MIKESKEQKFDLILTKEISRFSRNTLDSIKYTQELLKNGVGVIFLNDNINTILPDSELRLTIMASVAQDEVRKLSERVKFGMKRSIEKGVVLGSSNIIGYDKNNGTLTINPKEEKIIKIIYDKYANTTMGAAKISKYLYELGFKNQNNKPYSPSVITKIIENPKYKGYYCGNKTKILDYKNNKKIKLDKTQWITYKDPINIPPIVNENTWNKANKKLEARRKSFKNKKELKEIYLNRYTYSGIIYCATHNLTYHHISSGKRKNNPVWECQIYRKESLKGCNNPRIYEYELDKIIKIIINKIIDDNKIISKELIKEIKQSFNENNLVNNQLEKEKTTIKNKKEKLLNLLIEDIIDKNIYKQEIQILNKNLNTINDKLKANIKTNTTNLENKINKALQECTKNSTCLKNLVNILIKKIIVYKQEEHKQSKLEIITTTNEHIFVISDKKGKKYHYID